MPEWEEELLALEKVSAYPAQSNFTGVLHPLEWIAEAHTRGWDVLLDAACFVPTNRLDLSRWHPDFVPVSFYKMFGYPTGVGCLLARKTALARLRHPWFAGGTVWGASVQGDGYVLLEGGEAFEDGTLNYLSLPAVEIGLRHLMMIGMDTIHERIRCLTSWLLEALLSLRHSNGTPLVRIYGPHTNHQRGEPLRSISSILMGPSLMSGWLSKERTRFASPYVPAAFVIQVQAKQPSTCHKKPCGRSFMRKRRKRCQSSSKVKGA